MPTVGKGKNAKKFAYTPKGEAKAAAYAKKTGQKETYHPPAKQGNAPAKKVATKGVATGRVDALERKRNALEKGPRTRANLKKEIAVESKEIAAERRALGAKASKRRKS